MASAVGAMLVCIFVIKEIPAALCEYAYVCVPRYCVLVYSFCLLKHTSCEVIQSIRWYDVHLIKPFRNHSSLLLLINSCNGFP